MNFLPSSSDPVTTIVLAAFVVIGLALGLHYHSATVVAAMVASVSGFMSKYLNTIQTHSASTGGGAIPVRADVYPWRTWPVLRPVGQLHQQLPDGAETATWYNDCGETCASMLLRACRGVEVPADVLRLQVLGAASNGLTTAQNLVDILALNSVAAAVVADAGAVSLSRLHTSTQDGRPNIALGTWPTPGGVLHWVLVEYLDKDDTVHYINPWGGNRSWLSWIDWQKYSSNEYVELRSHMLFG